MERMSRRFKAVAAFLFVGGLTLLTIGASSGQPPPPTKKVVSTVFDGPVYYEIINVEGKLTAQKVTALKAGKTYKVVYDWLSSPAMSTSQKDLGSSACSYQILDAQGNPTGTIYNEDPSPTEALIVGTGETKALMFAFTPPSSGTWRLTFRLNETFIMSDTMYSYYAEAKTETKDKVVDP